MADPSPVFESKVLSGRYHLVRRVARGGMAEVWEGHDEVLSRSIAVKMLLPHLAVDEMLLERFRREAVTAAALSHPGIVSTFDAGIDHSDDRDIAFMVMELVRGSTLRTLMANEGPLPIPLVVNITVQVADALGHAHSHGLVHRDIKPANVLLTDEGWSFPRVKVADFGIAKATEGIGADLTKTGILLGTPKYLSPEQIRGAEPDGRADLYSLGVILYEMLAGEAPFAGRPDMALALAHVNEEPPRISSRRTDLPPGLAGIVNALMAKDRDKRIPSGAALRAALISLGLVTDPTSTQLQIPRNLKTGKARVGPDSTWAGGPTQLSPSPLHPKASKPPKTSKQGTKPSPGIRRKRLPGVIVGIVALVAALTAWALVGNRLTHSPAEAAPSIVSVKEVVTDGNHPNDNTALLPKTFDHNPATSWTSKIYAGPHFGGYGGLGLAIQLSGVRDLHTLTVQTSMNDWSAQVYVGQSFSSQLSAWGSPITQQSSVNGPASFQLSGHRASWVLLWMTDPGPNRMAQIGDLSVT